MSELHVRAPRLDRVTVELSAVNNPPSGDSAETLHGWTVAQAHRQGDGVHGWLQLGQQPLGRSVEVQRRPVQEKITE